MNISGKMLRDAIISGAYNIIIHKAEVDELNVFPVPDGDTGTNMSMTIKNALPELKEMSDDITEGQDRGFRKGSCRRAHKRRGSGL